MRRRVYAPFPERLGHWAAAATSRWARASAIRSIACCRSRFDAAALSISEVKVGSWKLLHHAIVSTGAALTVLASSCFGTGCNASSVQLVGVSAFGDTQLGPTVHLNGVLWTCLLFLAGIFIFSGVNKAFRPVNVLVARGQTGAEGLPKLLSKRLGRWSCLA